MWIDCTIVRADPVQFKRWEANLVARLHAEHQILVVANFFVPIYASALSEYA